MIISLSFLGIQLPQTQDNLINFAQNWSSGSCYYFRLWWQHQQLLDLAWVWKCLCWTSEWRKEIGQVGLQHMAIFSKRPQLIPNVIQLDLIPLITNSALSGLNLLATQTFLPTQSALFLFRLDLAWPWSHHFTLTETLCNVWALTTVAAKAMRTGSLV